MSEAFPHLGDDELTDRWLDCSLGGTGIKHLDHVRIAWVLVRRLGRRGATGVLVEATRRACEHYGVPERFDERFTKAWAEAVADAGAALSADTFRGFIVEHPELGRSDALGAPAWRSER